MKLLPIVVLCAAQAFAYNAYKKTEDECIENLLFVVDCSNSVRKERFDGVVKPFLRKLIREPNLNVGPQGTSIAMIVFSTGLRAKILFNFGKQRTADEVIKDMEDKLLWNSCSGDRTETDIALQLAKQIFYNSHSGNNAVVIITDGKPNGLVFGAESRTKQRAAELKRIGIRVIAAAVGDRAKETATFFQDIATTPNDVVAADFNKMDNIMSKLVASSCGQPGNCECSKTSNLASVRAEPGETTAAVDWPQPSYACSTGMKAEELRYTVQPNVRPGDKFGIGKHTMVYTFHLNGGVEVQCPVMFEVLPPLEYCGNKVYSSARQVCCCGAIRDKKPGHDCCGTQYYATSNQKCCKNANLVSQQEACLGA